MNSKNVQIVISKLVLQEEDRSGLEPLLFVAAGDWDVDEGQDLLTILRVVERQPDALARTVVVSARLQDPGESSQRHLGIIKNNLKICWVYYKVYQ